MNSAGTLISIGFTILLFMHHPIFQIQNLFDDLIAYEYTHYPARTNASYTLSHIFDQVDLLLLLLLIIHSQDTFYKYFG